MGTTRLRRGRPPTHPIRMGRRAARTRLQPGLLSAHRRHRLARHVMARAKQGGAGPTRVLPSPGLSTLRRSTLEPRAESGAATAAARLSTANGLWIPPRADPRSTTAHLTAKEHKRRV